MEANRPEAGRVLLLLLLLLLLLIFLQGNDNYIPETNHVSGVYNITVILCLQYVVATCNVISHDK
jgi:hypothetical protein